MLIMWEPPDKRMNVRVKPAAAREVAVLQIWEAVLTEQAVLFAWQFGLI